MFFTSGLLLKGSFYQFKEFIKFPFEECLEAQGFANGEYELEFPNGDWFDVVFDEGQVKSVSLNGIEELDAYTGHWYSTGIMESHLFCSSKDI
jgi:hypothetical protein